LLIDSAVVERRPSATDPIGIDANDFSSSLCDAADEEEEEEDVDDDDDEEAECVGKTIE
jgi:hypothetical protein